MNDKEKAYIAGFLDGDGSIMLQLKPRKKVSFGFRVRTIICFYQDSRYEKGLAWIRGKIGIGYLSRRKDRITELRIEGHKTVKNILEELSPFIIFKAEQAKIMLKAILIMEENFTPEKLLEVCKLSDKISSINYATTRKKYDYKFVKKKLVKKGLITP